ncbi:MAG: hypothetical protein AAB608_01055 [Patescibacteria group bacterium]
MKFLFLIAAQVFLVGETKTPLPVHERATCGRFADVHELLGVMYIELNPQGAEAFGTIPVDRVCVVVDGATKVGAPTVTRLETPGGRFLIHMHPYDLDKGAGCLKVRVGAEECRRVEKR